MEKANAHTSATSSVEGQNRLIETVFERERRRLLSFIRRRLPAREDAEDILQDVFAELVETFRFARPVEQFASWLFAVARNRVIDRRRKRRPELLEDAVFGGREAGEEEVPYLLAELLPDNGSGPEESLWLAALMEALDEALEGLPSEQREVFVLHEIEGLSFKEIAGKTGEPLNTLLSRKYYAVRALRQQLQAFYNEWLNN